MKDQKTHKEGIVGFEISYSPSYKTATVWYYPYILKLFKEKNWALLRQSLSHEMAHILTNPLADIANDRYVSKRELDVAVESLTESIAQIGRELMRAKGIKLE